MKESKINQLSDQKTTKIYLKKNKMLFQVFIVFLYLIFIIYFIYDFTSDFLVNSFDLIYFILIIICIFNVVMRSYEIFNNLKLIKKKIAIIILDEEFIKIFYKGSYNIYKYTEFIKIEKISFFIRKYNHYEYKLYLKRGKNKYNLNLLDSLFTNLENPFLNIFSKRNKDKIIIYYFMCLDHSSSELLEKIDYYKSIKE